MKEANAWLSALAEKAAEDDNIAVLWLYGSRAKGSEQRNSDYDLAVAFNHFPEDPLERRLQPELLGQQWADGLRIEPGQLSVVDINHIPIQLAYSIIQSGQVLQVNDPLRLAREENRITSIWEIDHQYHRKHYG